MRHIIKTTILLLSTSLAACGGDDTPGDGVGGTGGTGGTGGGGNAGFGGGGGASQCDAAPSTMIEIAGAFIDNFDGTHHLDDESWVSGSSRYDVVDYSNDARWIVAQNHEDNDFNAGAYSRFDWTYDDTQIYYCQAVFDAESAEEAENGAGSDEDDLSTGCSGFEWTLLEPISLLGEYNDSFDGEHEITPTAWTSGDSVFHLRLISNEENWAVAYNDCGNAFNPGAYSRFDWTREGGAGGAGGAGGVETLYYCQTGYDLASQNAAKELDAADAGDLDEGCNGFPWTELEAR